ncbi:MAG: DegT/DnrJ/EryC1/StrS family aminotransferase [Deltaproteobacteria bacterium]|nr:DegT/DnrJ/EryC1/StrS family aminotransferase [Deltaproteobacteria bacterium]
MADHAPVPLLDLGAQYDAVGDDVRAAVERVLATHIFIGGPEVEGLEAEILDYCGMPGGSAVGLSSGTDALLAALMALGVGPGDEVVTTPFTFFATAGTIHRTGAAPVFADILPETFNLDPEAVRRAIARPRTKAVIPVHLYGQCADMDAILDAAGDVPVIEDAAQALGAEDKGRRAGSMGLAGCFSFFPSKNLGATGDAGMLVSRDPSFGERVRKLRNHGETTRYHHQLVGGNFRLDAMHAAALRVKLPHLDGWSDARGRNAEKYNTLFREAGLVGDAIAALPDKGAGRHVFNQYVLRVKNRDALVKFLQSDAKVGCAIYYPIPLHLQECFAYLGYKEGDFPAAERAAQETIALPVFPELTGEQQRYVVESIKRFYAGK